jgi:hypothetical protein
MKKIITLTIISLLVLSSNFTVLSENNNDGKNKKLKKYINTRIEYPATENDVTGFVLVEYYIDTTGTLSINAINASNPELEEHVQNSINNLSNYPVAEVLDTFITCKYIFVSDKDYKKVSNSNSGMKSIIGINDITANNL